jgi:hypothetical protein
MTTSACLFGVPAAELREIVGTMQSCGRALHRS